MVLAVMFLYGTLAAGRRALSSSCPACPADAITLCASQSPAEIQANLGLLEGACGSYAPMSCCGLRHGGSWERVSACACAGGVQTAVQMRTVENVCGCEASEDRSALPQDFFSFSWGGL